MNRVPQSSQKPTDFARRLPAYREAAGGRCGTPEPERVESGRWHVAKSGTIRGTDVNWRRLYLKGVVNDNCRRMCKSLETRLIETIRRAHEDGSPITGSSPEKWAEVAAIARRRWFSFGRRNRTCDSNLVARIDDLSRGLCETFTPGGLPMAGQLIEDYRWLAEQLAKVFESESE